MDEMNRTIIDTNGGWGGTAWGAGLGAFVGAMFGNQFSISQQNQTQAIINALKPATTTGA